MPVPQNWAFPASPTGNLEFGDRLENQAGQATAKKSVPLPENTQAWWDEFCDSDMKQMIKRLIEINPNLHRARARIDEALAQRITHRAGRLPHTDFTSRRDSGFAEFDGSGKVKFKDTKSRGDFWQIDAGWEFDIFGEHARAIEASDSQARSTIEAWRDVLVFLIGEIGIYYTEMRVNEERTRLAQEFVNTYKEVARISVAKKQSGAVSKLEVEEALARLKSQESQVPDFQRKAAIARNRLARLLACSSDDLSQYIGPEGVVPEPPSNIYAGVPTEVVRARADIRASEDKIAAQVARVGAATARIYPKLHLSGAITYETIVRGDVTELLRRSIGGGGTLAKRLFHAGADKARIKEEDAILQQTIRTYEVTVLDAINEVEDALADLHFGNLRKATLDDAANSSKKANSRIQEAYAMGLVDIGDLLRVVEDDFEIRTENLFARNLLAKASVRLYKAAGGGQLPLPPVETPENLVATEHPGGILRPLSVLFSLGTDTKFTLHPRRMLARNKPKNAKPPSQERARRYSERDKNYPFIRAYHHLMKD